MAAVWAGPGPGVATDSRGSVSWLSEEADRLLWCPDAPLRRGWPAQDRGTGGVVGEAVLADGVAEGAGEGARRLERVTLPRPAASWLAAKAAKAAKVAMCRCPSWSSLRVPSLGIRSLWLGSSLAGLRDATDLSTAHWEGMGDLGRELVCQQIRRSSELPTPARRSQGGKGSPYGWAFLRSARTGIGVRRVVVADACWVSPAAPVRRADFRRATSSGDVRASLPYCP